MFVSGKGMIWMGMVWIGRVSERTVCDPFFKHATVGYVVTW